MCFVYTKNIYRKGKKMGSTEKLDQLIEKFTNDPSWNTVNADGTHRFDKEIAWIRTMFMEYSDALQIPVNDLVEVTEKARDCSWPNYYQPCNFPDVSSDNIIGVFKDSDDFRTHAKNHWAGFKCPHCGTISDNPEKCDKCDWCSYGLFSLSKGGVVILSAGIKLIPIFDPVVKENAEGDNDDD